MRSHYAAISSEVNILKNRFLNIMRTNTKLFSMQFCKWLKSDVVDNISKSETFPRFSTVEIYKEGDGNIANTVLFLCWIVPT